jgi:DNA end-binding protein Ku
MRSRRWFYQNELHNEKKGRPPSSNYTAQDLEMANSLVSHLAAPFKLELFHDAHRQSVERLIEAKKNGEKITTVKQPAKAKLIDLMEALTRSLRSTPPPAGAAIGKALLAPVKNAARQRSA